jgi:hypothetical protein
MTRKAALLAVALALAGCAPGPRAYVAEPLSGAWRVGILPLANYTPTRDAPDRLAPMLAVALAEHPGIQVVDMGRVEAALAKQPWIMSDRLPPDLVDSLGAEMGANALLVGSVLAYGYRESDGSQIPQVSLSLRLLEVPGGKVLWSAVHSRDGGDSESVFGIGRVSSLERLASETVEAILSTLPPVRGGKGSSGPAAPGDSEKLNRSEVSTTPAQAAGRTGSVTLGNGR